MRARRNSKLGCAPWLNDYEFVIVMCTFMCNCLWIYIVLLLAGGLMGFIKAGSKISLITCRHLCRAAGVVRTECHSAVSRRADPGGTAAGGLWHALCQRAENSCPRA